MDPSTVSSSATPDHFSNDIRRNREKKFRSHWDSNSAHLELLSDTAFPTVLLFFPISLLDRRTTNQIVGSFLASKMGPLEKKPFAVVKLVEPTISLKCRKETLCSRIIGEKIYCCFLTRQVKLDHIPLEIIRFFIWLIILSAICQKIRTHDR